MSIVLRDYQVNACEDILEFYDEIVKKGGGLKRFSTFLLGIPTGGGKTFTALYSIKEMLKKDHNVSFIWLTHRTELFSQTKQGAIDLNIPYKEYSAKDVDDPTFSIGLNVCMLGTLLSRIDKIKIEKDVSRIVFIIDEAHHTNKELFEYLDQKFRLITAKSSFICLTATPSKYLLKESDSHYSVSTRKLMRDGYLCSMEYVKVNTGFKYNANVRDDWSKNTLSSLNDNKRHELIFNTWKKNKNECGKSIFFFATIREAINFFNYANSKFPGNWYLVTGQTNSHDRKLSIDAFKADPLGCMINVSVFTEGFDDPEIKSVFICRPTTSPELYCQMIGRGMRKHHSKTKGYVYDFVDAVERHAIAAAEFSSKYLGAPIDKEISATLRYAEVYKWLGKNVSSNKRTRIKNSTVDFLSIIGLVEYQGKYDRKKKAFPINEYSAICVELLYLKLKHIYENNFNIKNYIQQLWGEIGFLIGCKRSQWSNFCWSIILNIKAFAKLSIFDTHGSVQVLTMPGFSKPSLPDYDEFVSDNVAMNSKFNNLYGKDPKKYLQKVINMLPLNYQRDVASKVLSDSLDIVIKDRSVVFYVSSFNKIKTKKWILEHLTKKLEQLTDFEGINVSFKIKQR